MKDTKPITISAIAAVGNQRQIGKDGELLWHIPEDQKRFKRLTKNKAVIMGRKTWESLPESVRPLPERENIVLTRKKDYKAEGVRVFHNFAPALSHAKNWSKKTGKDELFIIGGEAIYTTALPVTDKLYLTLVDSDASGDTHFPVYHDVFNKETFREVHNQNDPRFTFLNVKRK